MENRRRVDDSGDETGSSEMCLERVASASERLSSSCKRFPSTMTASGKCKVVGPTRTDSAIGAYTTVPFAGAATFVWAGWDIFREGRGTSRRGISFLVPLHGVGNSMYCFALSENRNRDEFQLGKNAETIY